MPRPRILDQARTPDGDELVLAVAGDDYYLQLRRRNLMSSVMHESEDALARLSLPLLAPRARPRILIGGLGMGFTLRAALDMLGPQADAEVVVAELIPAVVAWNRTVLADVAGRPLDDPRVRVEVEDVAVIVAADARPFDAILLDIDNGPFAFTATDNQHLYSPRGLGRLARGLSRGGVLGIWSACHEPRFAERMRRSGLAVDIHRIPSQHATTARRHVVYLGCSAS